MVFFFTETFRSSRIQDFYVHVDPQSISAFASLFTGVNNNIIEQAPFITGKLK